MITTSQIRNVLRIYGDQLKKRSPDIREGGEQTAQFSDFVDISIDARRKQTLNQMSDHLISQVNQPDYQKRTTVDNPFEDPAIKKN